MPVPDTKMPATIPKRAERLSDWRTPASLSSSDPALLVAGSKEVAK